jgi:hypothetical protein
MLLLPLGVFFAFLGGSSRIRLTGSVLAVLSYLVIAPWNDGVFLVIYLTTASVAASLLTLHREEVVESLNYMIAVFVGCIAASLYLASSNWIEFTQFEEKLTRELLEAGRESLSSGFYTLMEADISDFEWWLEGGVKAFVHLTPGFIILMTLAVFYLATTLLRGSSSSSEKLPEEMTLAEFRFDDCLLWLFTGGLILFVAPLPSVAKQVGANAAFVMGVLTMFRGIGIWVTYLHRRISSPFAKGIILVFFFMLFPPMAAGLALVTGLADIWVDMRKLGQRKGAL